MCISYLVVDLRLVNFFSFKAFISSTLFKNSLARDIYSHQMLDVHHGRDLAVARNMASRTCQIIHDTCPYGSKVMNIA